MNSTSENTEQSDAMNGSSNFIVQVFDEIGKHTLTAVRVRVPNNILASVYMIVEIEDLKNKANYGIT
ncbi:hypothetical protein PP182_17570 [Maribacter sp. PR1]|uniref:Uncharacterized protein n=1 Tax=Maribacter cobaltidurans TaxID=1178778 RepID=A0ABU7IYH9_9FLAO|nr:MULTISPECIES: hypothetical protein [Maribacter]MDC6390503.1 hypothetical protein [Maribacter sp. PR1]MEE1977893.1 hypothetical protein [Maribacter cobaltidurans]